MTEQIIIIFAVVKRNPDLMAWLGYLAKRFGKRTIGEIIGEHRLTGDIRRIERG